MLVVHGLLVAVTLRLVEWLELLHGLHGEGGGVHSVRLVVASAGQSLQICVREMPKVLIIHTILRLLHLIVLITEGHNANNTHLRYDGGSLLQFLGLIQLVVQHRFPDLSKMESVQNAET